MKCFQNRFFLLKLKEKRQMKKTIIFLSVFVLAITLSLPLYAAGKTPVDKAGVTNPQFFCGHCHVLSYPKIIKKAYKSWKRDKHSKKDVSCEECHYPPGDRKVDVPGHEKISKDKNTVTVKKKTERNFMKTQLEVLSRQITMLGMEESVVRTRPRIDDRSCTTCHSTTGKGKKGKFWNKKIKFAEYKRPNKTKGVVSFTHKKHFNQENWVGGQELHCTTCHNHQSEKSHFEVSKKTCFLCHFKNETFAEERANCSLCHDLPKGSIVQLTLAGKSGKKQEKEAINHKKLEKNKVPCVSCHLQVVRGDGPVNEGKCLNCHENSTSIMKKWDSHITAHENHVDAQTANCFNCHDTIQHKNGMKDFDHIDAALADCRECHSKPHLNQRQLLAGIGGHGLDKPYPIKHHDVNMNCIGCHNKKAHDEKGRPIKVATAEVCVSCHTEKERPLTKKWKEDVADFFIEARDMEKEALDALETAKGKLSKTTIKKAMILLKQGQSNLRIVDAGGGVHNKKYSVSLIDVAIVNFEDVIDMLNTN